MRDTEARGASRTGVQESDENNRSNLSASSSDRLATAMKKQNLQHCTRFHIADKILPQSQHKLWASLSTRPFNPSSSVIALCSICSYSSNNRLLLPMNASRRHPRQPRHSRTPANPATPALPPTPPPPHPRQSRQYHTPGNATTPAPPSARSPPLPPAKPDIPPTASAATARRLPQGRNHQLQPEHDEKE